MSLFCIDNDPTGGAVYGADVAALAVSGEVDYMATPHLRERIDAAMRSGRRHLVLDLSAVTLIDSTAIGVLVAAATRAQQSARGSLAIVCAEENERVLRIFDIAGVARLIALHHTRDDALAALSRAARAHLCESAAQATPPAATTPLSVCAEAARVAAAWRYARVAAVPAMLAPGATAHAASGRNLDELA
jgi:anti-anti-sigma factor